MSTLWIDTETYSERPLRAGMYAYAEACEVMLVTYAIDDGEPKCWQTQYEPMPAELENALRSDCEVVAHKVSFDRTVLRLGNLKIDIPLERWHCTMAQAMAHSLPGALAKLCVILNVDTAHHKIDGKHLIQLFCKPRPKNSKLRRATRETHPKEWAEFVEYATQDIPAMRAVRRKLPAWNYRGDELALWRLDQRINDRGIAADLELSRAALATIERVQKDLAEQTHAATNGEVEATTQRDKLLKHLLAEYGVTLHDLTASTIERRLDDPDLPEPVKELLRMRQEAALTSGKKHSAILKGASSDGRLRGLLSFCGASRTGRWSGQLVQPQNLPRGNLHGADYDAAIEAIKSGAVDLLYDKPLEVISGTVRGALIAPPGRKLVIADLSNIEGRMLAWLAGEEWKTAAYAEGQDLYKLAYGRTFGKQPDEVTKAERQIGKVMELALGYQGAVGAFSKMAAVYGVELPEEQVVALVKGWRKANSRIASFWYDLEDTAKRAIQNPGEPLVCRRLKLRYSGGWLGIGLPSGRTLCYPRARVEPDGKIAYDGTNQYTRKWGKIATYGGKLVENVTQAASRDVMGYAMPFAEAAEFEIVLSVHDELVTEAPDTPEFSADRLSAILATNPPWADGLPLAAAGFETTRYRKD